MGAGSSTDSTAASELANSLLTKLFTQTDMLSYLTMTDPKACANFDFSSVNPAMQQNIRAAGGQVRILGGQADRTAVCFEQAKGYSKCFELYAALYPLLADGSVKRSGIVMKGGRRTRRQREGELRHGVNRMKLLDLRPLKLSIELHPLMFRMNLYNINISYRWLLLQYKIRLFSLYPNPF